MRIAAKLLNVLFAFSLVFPIVGQSPVGKSQQTITVKVRNGKTGLPIWLASPCVYVGKFDLAKQDQACRKTKFWSDAHVDVSGADPRTLTVVLDFIHRDCQYAEATASGAVGDFDLDTILKKGVVAPNLCSSRTQLPEPSVVVMYVIPSTF